MELLDNDDPDARANALLALGMDTPENLEPYKSSLVARLEDSSPRVRTLCARLLRLVKDEGVEAALVQALSRTPVTEEHRDEIYDLTHTLGNCPIVPDRVIPAVAPLIDVSLPTTIVWETIQASQPLSSSQRRGEELIERYWKVLSETDDDGLASVAATAISQVDPRTLPYLRNAPRVPAYLAKATAAYRLAGHFAFSIRTDRALTRTLLEDPSPQVRAAFIGGLCSVPPVVSQDPARDRLEIALESSESDRDEGVRVSALSGALHILQGVPAEGLAQLMHDRSLRIRERMLRALDREDMRRIVVLQTRMLVHEPWSTAWPLEYDEARARRFWETRKFESPSPTKAD